MPRLVQSPVLAFLSAIFLISADVTNAFGQPPAACECLWQGPFIQVVDSADLVVSGTVVAQKGNSFDLQVESTLRDQGVNQHEFRDTIRVWGNNGALCRPDVEAFAPQSQWLLGLKKITAIPDNGFNPRTPNISFGRENDYYLSSCGAYWLELHDGRASGPLVNASRWQWQDDAMNPVLIELIVATMNGVIPVAALQEAAKPQTATKRLMDSTKQYLDAQ